MPAKDDDKDSFYCKDCKFSFVNFFEVFTTGPLCRKYIIEDDVDLVTGKRKIAYGRCSSARRFDICGPEGKAWLPKHKKDLFKLLKREQTQ